MDKGLSTVRGIGESVVRAVKLPSVTKKGRKFYARMVGESSSSGQPSGSGLEGSLTKLSDSVMSLTKTAKKEKERTVKKQENEKLLYKYKKEEFGQRIINALNSYLDDPDKSHGDLLRGYLAEDALKGFFVIGQDKNDKDRVKTVYMPAEFEDFDEKIAVLLEGHSTAGSLLKGFQEKFKNSGFFIEMVGSGLRGEYKYRLIYKEPTESQSDLPTPKGGAEKGTLLDMLKKQEQERELQQICNKVNTAYKNRRDLTRQVERLRQLVDVHGDCIKWWSCPQIDSVDLGTLTDIKPDKHMSMPALEKLQADVENENNNIQGEIDALWKSLPSAGSDRQLITIPEVNDGSTSLITICEGMNTLLTHPLRRTAAEFVKGQCLFRRAYRDEQAKNTQMAEKLMELKELFQAIKNERIWRNFEQLPWSQNLMAEWLQQNVPTELYKLGRIKCSSLLRKAWKGKLTEWNIPRGYNPRHEEAETAERVMG